MWMENIYWQYTSAEIDPAILKLKMHHILEGQLKVIKTGKDHGVKKRKTTDRRKTGNTKQRNRKDQIDQHKKASVAPR